MATQPTNLPVPSETARDLKFNAGKIDEFVTSSGWTYTDRFGNKHYTIEGINYLAQQVMNSFGYVTLTDVSFTTGATITKPNEVLFNEANNEYYKWTSSFASGPKVVPANSTPESTGGIGAGKWLSVGDSTLRSDLSSGGKASLVGYLDGTVADELGRSRKRNGNLIYAADYLPDSYTAGDDLSAQMLEVAAAVNAVPNTERNGSPVTLEFPSGWFKHSSTLLFTRPVVLTSTGDTKLEFIGNGNQIKFGPDGITFNGDGGGIDHRLHVTYGFIGSGVFTFTGDLSADGIVFNEYVTNPRILGLRFIDYGSESYYQVKLWGHCWDITVDNIRHSYTKSKAVNWLSANGKMKDGTVDYGNSRLHIGSDVYLHIEGTISGGVCVDVGGVDYKFDGVAQGWKITHQLGSFASNPIINGYHETIYPECEALITYGGTTDDNVVREDHYFDGGVIGATSIYWNAHNISGPEGYPATNCVFMKPGRNDVVLRNTTLNNVNMASYDNTRVLVSTNLVSGLPSYGNMYGYIGFPSIMLHEQNALVQPWVPKSNLENLVINGSGRLSRLGSSFTFNSTATRARVFDFWEYSSSGSAICSFYRSLLSNDTQFTHAGASIGIVIPTANSDAKSLHSVIDSDVFKAQGKELTLSFMAVNGTPSVITKLSVNLVLVYSLSEGVQRVYSFGMFDIGPSWGLKKFTINIPFEGLISTDEAIAYLSFEIPSNQTANIEIANVNLTNGNVAVQGVEERKTWEILSQSLAYYGS